MRFRIWSSSTRVVGINTRITELLKIRLLFGLFTTFQVCNPSGKRRANFSRCGVLSFIAATTPSAYVKKIIKSERKSLKGYILYTDALRALCRRCKCVCGGDLILSFLDVKPLRRQILNINYSIIITIHVCIFSGKSSPHSTISGFHQIPGGPLFPRP